jgi:hypothetical protein
MSPATPFVDLPAGQRATIFTKAKVSKKVTRQEFLTRIDMSDAKYDTGFRDRRKLEPQPERPQAQTEPRGMMIGPR